MIISAPIQVAKSAQLPLRFTSNRGGRRDGAERPAGHRRTVAHRTRPEHRARFPLHVTMRARAGLPTLREPVLAAAVRRAISAASREPFRVVHFSIQGNHLHFIIEAHDKPALSRGMQGLNIRVARAINRVLRLRGGVWRERYHGRELRTPRSVRNAIVYVLMNAKKHGLRFASGLDALSSTNPRAKNLARGRRMAASRSHRVRRAAARAGVTAKLGVSLLARTRQQRTIMSHIEILESAISDVGYWRWWVADLPERFQLEFGGAQLWSPPPAPDRPPSGLIAIRLIRPKRITLWTREDAPLSADWFEAMQRDELDPFSVRHDRFTLSSHEDAAAWAREAATKRDHFVADGVSDEQRLAVVAFWAGPVGLHAVCERIEIANLQGTLTPEAVEEANAKWWKYWREYWDRKDGPDAMPRDYACEVCIPAGA
jgi:putative transposase